LQTRTVCLDIPLSFLGDKNKGRFAVFSGAGKYNGYYESTFGFPIIRSDGTFRLPCALNIGKERNNQ